MYEALLIFGFITTAQAVILRHPHHGISSSWGNIIKEENSNNLGIVCPGGSQCPEFATCCQMTSGQWGCCPFTEAVCCGDKIHCCPKNNVCDLAQQRCTTSNNQDDSMPLAKKFTWKNPGFHSITCPDQQSECPDSTTCCQMASGDWGCCPFDSAVCCSDKLHCCPKSTVCNLAEQRCQKSHAEPMQKHDYNLHQIAPNVIKINSLTNVTDKICPDYHPCKEDTTCCQMKSGKYGCCPFPNADCCPDGLHCCPGGSKCDVEKGKCA